MRQWHQPRPEGGCCRGHELNVYRITYSSEPLETKKTNLDPDSRRCRCSKDSKRERSSKTQGEKLSLRRLYVGVSRVCSRHLYHLLYKEVKSFPRVVGSQTSTINWSIKFSTLTTNPRKGKSPPEKKRYSVRYDLSTTREYSASASTNQPSDGHEVGSTGRGSSHW